MNDWSDDTSGFAEAPLSRLAMPRASLAPGALDGLNAEQRKVVETLDGPVLVLAGAGTGKTRALTVRIANLLAQGLARPDEILSVTFTNKAAREMRERIGALVGGVVEGMPWLGTFHAICVKMLRRHAELVGLKSNFTILDSDDQLRLMKQVIEAAGIDEKRWPPRQLAGVIDRWKNRALTPDKIPQDEAAQFAGQGAELYRAYQERLVTLNAADFGDLLLHTVRILTENPDILARYHRRFRYILVDEYQDTNIAQYMWLRLLARGSGNICCVGDDDQSIYGWRGAEVGNILRFEHDFPGAVVIRLERNYRSTRHILSAASGVIRANRDRLGKELWTADDGGEKVRLIGHWDGEEEARWVGEQVEALSRPGENHISPNEMAILVRASHQMRAFEDRFLTIGLPYRVIGGPRFYERQEIRDAMAYFRVVTQPDDGLAFQRIVNTPRRGLGDKAQAEIAARARRDGSGLVEAARALVDEGALGARATKSLKGLLSDLDRWRAMLAAPDADHVAAAGLILDESGYTGMLLSEKNPDAPGRLENLKELVKALNEFENLVGFLEHVALVMDNARDDGAEKISIMTLHAAKGLEFDAVFLPGWEEGIFPSQRALDESGVKGLEEERRLAYVGITRARRLCSISFAANRRVYSQWQSAVPSRFIDELPSANVDVATPPGLAATGRWDDGACALEARAARADAYNSPGWRRLQRAVVHRSPLPQEARRSALGNGVEPAFSVGSWVFHQKFGYGAVTGAEGEKITVSFESSGVKKIVAGFLSAADSRGYDG
jgi:DNA helicase-2/ATP-dependent DNA helicase PcrA